MGGDKIEKITIMVLKVDLQCSSCYKKVKKVLCKFPQIRDQVYDEKANSVTIKVFCCNPEKIRDKLCYKGGGVIKSIEIKEPPKPKELEKPEAPEKPKAPEKPVPVEKPKEPEKLRARVEDKPNPKKPKPPPIVSEEPKKLIVFKKPEKLEEVAKPTPAPALVAPPPQPQPQFPPLMVMQIQGYPPCCDECYQDNSGGPCYHHERPIQPPPPAPCYSYGYGPGPVPYGLPRGCYVSKCDYFSDENASGCSIT